MERAPFYAGGLRFSCTRCSSCCRYEPGFVFLSKRDADMLAGELRMGYDEFTGAYCRWIPVGGGVEHLSLREKAGYDCIFWKDGCEVYGARPFRCRSFPFWPSVIASKAAWRETGASCPGIDRGNLHDAPQIEAWLMDLRDEPPVSRAGRWT